MRRVLGKVYLLGATQGGERMAEPILPLRIQSTTWRFVPDREDRE